MVETRKSKTLYLIFLFFFVLTVATQTTASVKCQTGSLRYPFGFSAEYPIRFNCSKKTGDVVIGEFVVQEVTDANIFLKIPLMCKRDIREIEYLFEENFAPSNLQNQILLQGCKKEQSISCSINPKFLVSQIRLNLSRCDSIVHCPDTATTADVMSIEDVSRSGCAYWLSSLMFEPRITKLEVPTKFGGLMLDWWLKEGCGNTTCSVNAKCTDVKLADGKLGHRCTCLEGFHGDAFTVPGGCRQSGFSSAARKGIWLSSGLVVVMLIAGGMFCVISWRRKTSNEQRQQNLKAFIPLKHYSYTQVKRMTKSFAEVVGKGGFGTVYRGTLCDGRSVAVKVLKDSKGTNGEDFINEVASMSKTSHINIVSLLGFCSEGSKRAILYEFLENGSLDKFISGNMTSMSMNWTKLYEIGLGVARGLEYLHYGCKTRIVHFDIKPSNILLDKNLCPKVSDFGLAKLCEKKESIMSLLDTRGTIGYIAPEMISRVYGSVSHKSDVYSYGMLVLEMIGARNKTSTEHSASNKSSMYFPEWIYKDLEKVRDNRRLGGNGIISEEDEIAKKMTLVGLWCIQSSPSDRPPMNRVVEMMEGSLNALEVPPRPVLQSPAPPFQESSKLSEIL